MKLLLFFFTLLFVDFPLDNTSAMADTHIYRGRYTNSSDILCTWDGKHLYRGRYTNFSDILLTFGGLMPVPVMLMALI